jgi:CheY-like chemotaxis protein
MSLAGDGGMSGVPLPRRGGLKGVRVLLVEDEHVVALELAWLLRDAGCRVLGPARSVVEALALLGRERPDAAVLDLELLDGLAAPVAALLTSMGVPFVLAVPEGADAGHPAFVHAPRLGKPISEARLRRGITELLGMVVQSRHTWR